MELKSTVQSYDELLSLDMFRVNQEVTLENFENILIDYEIKDVGKHPLNPMPIF